MVLLVQTTAFFVIAMSSVHYLGGWGFAIPAAVYLLMPWPPARK